MDGFDPLQSFGESVASSYVTHLRGDEEETVTFLAALAGDEPAYELAVGTGRIAVPLAATGIAVDGIEQSQAMIDRIPADSGVRAVRGDMAHDPAPGGPYSLVFLVYNTIYNLLTQADQVACFDNAARHLAPGGVFVVEAAVPEAWLKGRRAYVDVEHVAAGAVRLDVNSYDPVSQVLSENHVSLTSTGATFGPIACRLAPPAELDLMARIAGLRLMERHGGWHREPFTADSVRHVSVYAC